MIDHRQFRFRVSTNLRYGAGESEKLGAEIKDLGFTSAAAIVDQAIAAHPQVVKALKSVPDAGIKLAVFQSSEAEPSYHYLDSFRKQLEGKNFDCLIGIGGGSAMDLAKGIAVLLTNPGPAITYKGFPKLKNKPMPVIEVPTTAGTGSEVTFNAVFTDTDLQKKLGINSMLNFPVAAIIDPLITADCPASVSISSGSDALVHTLESFVHKDHTPISRMYSIEAFRLLFNNLGAIIDRPSDLEARGCLALGAYLAATALMNSGSGPAAAFSYPLGVHYKVPHGFAGAVFLSSITRFNVENGYKDYSILYDVIEGADKNLPISDKCRKFADLLQALMDKVRVPRTLSQYKLGPKDIEFMASQYDTLKAAIAQNPIAISKTDAERLLRALA